MSSQSSNISISLQSFLIASGALVLSGYFLSKLFNKKHPHERRRQFIQALVAKQKEIAETLARLNEEEESEHINENPDYSQPVNDPAVKKLETASPARILMIRENSKIKDKVDYLGDYTSLNEKDFDGDYEFYLKDGKALKKKIKNMIKDGINELQIVSDFDQTTTAFSWNSEACNSLFGSFRHTDQTSQSFKKTTQSLYTSYAPIEIDTNIDISRKRLLLKDWYDAVKAAFLHENLTREKILQVLNDANLALRYGYREFFNICKVLNLPYYMISGGITQMVQTIIAKVADINNYSNFFTFSNDMVFDKEGNLKDLHMKVYATTKAGILDKRKFAFKKNTLLFGDLVTDYDMASRMDSENIVSIAFLERKKENMLKNYLEKFDVVILGDGDFLIPDLILRKVAGVEENPFFKEKIEENKKIFQEIIELFEE